MSSRLSLLAVLLLAFVTAHTAYAGTVLDDFNRPDSTNIGSNWTVQDGAFQITSGQLALYNSGRGLATYNGVSSTNVSLDVSAVSGTSYAAIVLGYHDALNNLFIKVQNNGSSSAVFENYAFYYGNNGSGSGWAERGFYSLPQTFASGRITATLVGDVANLFIDTNFDGTPEMNFSAGSVPLSLIGTGIGIGEYGNIRVDNFAINGGGSAIPEPASMLLIGASLLTLAAISRRHIRR